MSILCSHHKRWGNGIYLNYRLLYEYYEIMYEYFSTPRASSPSRWTLSFLVLMTTHGGQPRPVNHTPVVPTVPLIRDINPFAEMNFFEASRPCPEHHR